MDNRVLAQSALVFVLFLVGTLVSDLVRKRKPNVVSLVLGSLLGAVVSGALTVMLR